MSDAGVQEFFGNTIDRDVFRLLCGDVLGEGIARTVYECPLRPELVVKVETPSQSFQNILEWEFWRTWTDVKELGCWLAPCEAISPCGTVLLQRRTTPIPDGGYPAKLPKFLTDTKRSNFGMLDGRVVCHDYGRVVSDASHALRKAEWWE